MASWADFFGVFGHQKKEPKQGSTLTISPFLFNTIDLGKIIVHGKEHECIEYIKSLGGVAEIAKSLNSSIDDGINASYDDIAKREEAFGENKFPEPPFSSWFSFFFDCFTDTVLLILIAASFASLGIGLYEDPSNGYMDGLAILVSVVIIAVVTATNDYNKQLQFRALSNQSKARVEVSVIRKKQIVSIPVDHVLVGDVVKIETGSKIPADGILISASNLATNESALTGESDEVKKVPITSPILLSGTQVTAGTGLFLVTAVGLRSMQGSIVQDTNIEGTDTPLQVKLGALVKMIGYIGFFCALGTFIAMITVKAAGGVHAQAYSWDQWAIKAVLYAVTIIVVAIPEGLPLAVTVSLAYSTKKMLLDQNLIRHLDACETMGSATDVCSDKTGTLTENRMTVVKAWLNGVTHDLSSTPASKSIPSDLHIMLRDHLVLNSTAELVKSEKSDTEFDVKGNKTEGASLLLVHSLGFDVAETRKMSKAMSSNSVSVLSSTGGSQRSNPILYQQCAFCSIRKMMSSVLLYPSGKAMIVVTGASEYVLARCTSVLTPEGTKPLSSEMASAFRRDVIDTFASESLRTVALAYRDFESISEVPPDPDNPPEFELTLYGLLGIKDPLRKDVKDAILSCQKAGVTVRMVTGDNRECGILQENSLVMEGPEFRLLTPSELDKALPRLAVLARSSPRDKNILVRRLNGNLPKTRAEWEAEHPEASWDNDKSKILPGYYEEWAAARIAANPKFPPYKAVVGVTGDGTNDAPALKASDVGLAMGLSGTQVAMEASDIIILDDRFSSIVKAILWGRNVYDSVQKFLQFQLTVNIVALILTFLAAVLQHTPPLNPVMMLWVNLIMDTLGALALGTEAPSQELLDRRPYSASASLILPRMWRQIIVQSIFQLVMLLLFLQYGLSWFNITSDFLQSNLQYVNLPSGIDPAYYIVGREDLEIYLSTFIFNTFVFAQLFNQINSRSLTDDGNILRGMGKNLTFLAILGLELVLQVIIVELGGRFSNTSGLTPVHWIITIALGAISLPLGYVSRYIPVPPRKTDFADFFRSSFYDSVDSSNTSLYRTNTPLASSPASYNSRPSSLTSSRSYRAIEI
jgi:P-type Ca2+ transporter type 2C